MLLTEKVVRTEVPAAEEGSVSVSSDNLRIIEVPRFDQLLTPQQMATLMDVGTDDVVLAFDTVTGTVATITPRSLVQEPKLLNKAEHISALVQGMSEMPEGSAVRSANLEKLKSAVEMFTFQKGYQLLLSKIDPEESERFLSELRQLEVRYSGSEQSAVSDKASVLNQNREYQNAVAKLTADSQRRVGITTTESLAQKILSLLQDVPDALGSAGEKSLYSLFRSRSAMESILKTHRFGVFGSDFMTGRTGDEDLLLDPQDQDEREVVAKTINIRFTTTDKKHERRLQYSFRISRKAVGLLFTDDSLRKRYEELEQSCADLLSVRVAEEQKKSKDGVIIASDPFFRNDIYQILVAASQKLDIDLSLVPGR